MNGYNEPMKAIIIQGGWSGHEPEVVAAFFTKALEAEGYTTIVSDTLDAFNDLDALKGYDLISPCWTAGELSKKQSANLREAIHSGTGLGGCHGGMGDAFRGDLDYEWMVGGHFVGHPHVGEYTVKVKDGRPSDHARPAGIVYLRLGAILHDG